MLLTLIHSVADMAQNIANVMFDMSLLHLISMEMTEWQILRKQFPV
jgi:hypothetical protein